MYCDNYKPLNCFSENLLFLKQEKLKTSHDNHYKRLDPYLFVSSQKASGFSSGTATNSVLYVPPAGSSSSNHQRPDAVTSPAPSTPTVNKRRSERKFPGPAGLLPAMVGLTTCAIAVSLSFQLYFTFSFTSGKVNLVINCLFCFSSNFQLRSIFHYYQS